jgi:hypothetical protein
MQGFPSHTVMGWDAAGQFSQTIQATVQWVPRTIECYEWPNP